MRGRGEGQEPDGAGVGGEEGEGGVRLEAGALGAAHDRVLPEVVSDGDAVEAALPRSARPRPPGWGQRLGRTGHPKSERCTTSFMP